MQYNDRRLQYTATVHASNVKLNGMSQDLNQTQRLKKTRPITHTKGQDLISY